MGWQFWRKSATREPERDPRSIESRMRALELDWEDAYERIRRVLQRISKRAEFIEKREANTEPTASAEPGDPTPPGVLGRLSDRQRAIQQQILRRRTGG